MNLAHIVLLFVAVQRLFELWLSSRNTRRLLAKGAKEFASGHYKWIVILHALWLVTLAAAAGRHAQIHAGWLAVFLGLQALRVWVLATLGGFWTTRIIRPSDNFQVRGGPYRFLRHPNYVIVVGEIFTLPMALGWPEIAVVFSVLNFIVLTVRIRAENAALSLGAVKSQSSLKV